MRINKYRVEKVFADNLPHYKIQVLAYMGLIWIDQDINPPTRDVSLIEHRLKELERTEICIIDRSELY